MAKPHAISALEKQYRRIAGERDAITHQILEAGTTASDLVPLERARSTCRKTLSCIVICLRLFDPDWTPDNIEPKKPRVRRSPFAHRKLMNMAYDILREAYPTPLSVAEITKRLWLNSKMTQAQSRDSAIKSALSTLLRGQEQVGAVSLISDRPLRWRIIKSRALQD